MFIYPRHTPRPPKDSYLKPDFLATSMVERNVVCGITADFSKESLKTVMVMFVCFP